MSTTGGVLILAPADDGRLHAAFWELVTVGRQLASELGTTLRVVVHGGDAGAVAEARRSGADQVHVAEDARLAEPWPDAHLEALTTLCRELCPSVILMPRTPLGMEVAARLAARLGVGLAPDAVRSAHAGERRRPGPRTRARRRRRRHGPRRAGTVRDAAGDRGPPRWCRRSVAPRVRRRMGQLRTADRIDREDRRARGVHRRRHLGSDPAHRRLLVVPSDRGDQHGPRSADLPDVHLRDRRRLEGGAAGVPRRAGRPMSAATAVAAPGRMAAVTDPATGDVIGHVPLGTAEDADRAVRRAHAAFGDWRARPMAERAALQHAAAAALRSRSDEFARSLTLELGRPLAGSRSEVERTAALLDYFAEEGLRLRGDIPLLGLPDERVLVVKEPVGVVVAIVPRSEEHTSELQSR